MKHQRIALLAPVLVSGCLIGPGILDAGGEPDETSTTGTSDDEATGTEGAPTTGDGDGDGDGEGDGQGDGDGDGDGDGIGDGDGDGEAPASCDMLAQDCGEGLKCVAVGPEGSSQYINVCVPADEGVGVAGELCIVNPEDWSDTCDANHVCWPTGESEGSGQLEGVCHNLCSPEGSCGGGELCGVFNEGVIGLCFVECEGDEGCLEGESCTWISGGGGGEEGLVCLPANEPVQGMDCTNLAQCPSGYVCILSEFMVDCETAACCTSFCDPNDPEACAGLEPLSCSTDLDWPEDVGVCALV